MLLGSLGPARTVLEKTLARPEVGCWTPCTGPGLSRAALGTKAAPSVLHSAPQLPWTCPRSSPLLVWARVPRVFRKQGQGASWRRWAAPGPAEVLLLLGSGQPQQPRSALWRGSGHARSRLHLDVRDVLAAGAWKAVLRGHSGVHCRTVTSASLSWVDGCGVPPAAPCWKVLKGQLPEEVHSNLHMKKWGLALEKSGCI